MESKIFLKKFFPLLKKVARSFYLTIRFLPQPLQEPVALAYLLARASDTMADEGDFSREERTTLLHSLKKGELPEQKWRERFSEKNHTALFSALPELVAYLDNSLRPPLEADAIRLVWHTILEGQLLDLRLQGTVFTPQERERYLYLVAGCVGEFWTRLGAFHCNNFSKEPLEHMMAWGKSYGKGLQLLNMLRDVVADRARGCFYFEPSERGKLLEELASYLEEGRLYVAALKKKRLRYASVLPLFLAEETRDLMLKKPPISHAKINRWNVFLILFRALIMFGF